jgi:hypothetical protein
LAKFIFKLPNLSAHRRLRHRQMAGGLGQAFEAGGVNEIA